MDFFERYHSSALSLAVTNSTLTIGSGITIHGGSQFPGTYSGAVLGFSDYWSGGGNASNTSGASH